ncbi:MAG: MarR family winged helix-turn-helix transcriptional regulator [Bacteroidota bacterium]
MEHSNLLKQLIDHWIMYSEANEPDDLGSFISWMENRLSNTSQSPSAIEEVTLQMTFGYLLGRIINFTDLWGKLGFKGLPIRQFEDLAILREIKNAKNPAKNELANVLVNEKSTVFEMLKRLKRDEMITDTLDTNDRRIRRVSLTPYGEGVLADSELQAQKIARILTGNLGHEELNTLVKLLHKLDVYHSRLHDAYNQEDIDELLHLTDKPN